MGYLREILATPEGVAQLKEDNTVFHLLLKCFLKAKDLDHTMQLYDTVTIDGDVFFSLP